MYTCEQAFEQILAQTLIFINAIPDTLCCVHNSAVLIFGHAEQAKIYHIGNPQRTAHVWSCLPCSCKPE